MGKKHSDAKETRRQIRQNLKAYKKKRSDTAKRLEQEFVDHGIATIPCKVSGMEDILSDYSVPGYESLSSEFVEYVSHIADLIPHKYPLVLSIVGKKFTKKEQEVIKSTIEYDAAYALGTSENDDKHLFKMGIVMVIGIIAFGLLIGWFNWWPELPREFLNVVFWFFTWTFVEYIVVDGVDHRKQKIRAARLTSMSVVFSEEYDDSDYSKVEAEEIFKEQRCK